MLDASEAAEALLHLRIMEPTPAWDVLNRVIKLANEEPRRLHMRTWGEFVADKADTYNYLGVNLPPCGTVACLAGWSSVVISGTITAMVPTQIAKVVAGRYHKELYDLFVAVHLTNQRAQGTPEHVEMVAAALQRFMDSHDVYLKARIVQPDPEGLLFGPEDWDEVEEQAEPEPEDDFAYDYPDAEEDDSDVE